MAQRVGKCLAQVARHRLPRGTAVVGRDRVDDALMLAAPVGLTTVQPGEHRSGDDDVRPEAGVVRVEPAVVRGPNEDRKSTRLNSSHVEISYAVFCLKKKKKKTQENQETEQSTMLHTERLQLS